MGMFLRPLLSALAVPTFLVLLLVELPAAGALAHEAPMLLLSAGLLVATTCLMSAGVFLAGRTGA